MRTLYDSSKDENLRLSEKEALLRQLQARIPTNLNINDLPQEQINQNVMSDILHKGALPNNDLGTGYMKWGNEPAEDYRQVVRGALGQTQLPQRAMPSQSENILGSLVKGASQVANIAKNPVQGSMDLIKNLIFSGKSKPKPIASMSEIPKDIMDKILQARKAGYSRDDIIEFYKDRSPEIYNVLMANRKA